MKITRRATLAATAAPLAEAMVMTTTAVASASTADPVLALYADWKWRMDWLRPSAPPGMDDDEYDRQTIEWGRSFARLAGARANTLHGVLLQLRALQLDFDSPHAEKALANALAALESMA